MKPLTKTQKLIIRRITVTFQREWLQHYKRSGKELTPIKVVSKKKLPIYKGKLGTDLNKLTTAKDLIIIGLLNPKKKHVSQQNTNLSTLYKLGYTNRSTKKHYRIGNPQGTKQRAPEIWNEELHAFIRPKPIFVKKEKKISLFWQKKLEEYENK